MDGVSNFQKSGANLILANPEGFVTEQALRFNFNTSNNSTEYEALIVDSQNGKIARS